MSKSAATIRTNCPTCGEVDLPPEDVILVVDEIIQATEDQEERWKGSYSFICPTCEALVEKTADKKIILLLLAVEDVEIAHAMGDWSIAFAQELSCEGTHRWDFPVKMGQRCLCGRTTWDNNQMPPRPDHDEDRI